MKIYRRILGDFLFSFNENTIIKRISFNIMIRIGSDALLILILILILIFIHFSF